MFLICELSLCMYTTLYFANYKIYVNKYFQAILSTVAQYHTVVEEAIFFSPS